MKTFNLLGLVLLAPCPTLAMIGLSIQMYDPLCAFACRGAIATTPLSCSSVRTDGTFTTSPACQSDDAAYLTTLAWCINSTCTAADVGVWRIEKFWADETTQDAAFPPTWDYSQALSKVLTTPTQDLTQEKVLNITVLVPQHQWEAQMDTMQSLEEQETLHSRYGLVLLLLGFATPILFTLISYLPYMTRTVEKVRPYLVHPATLVASRIQAFASIFGNAPTIGQGLYVALIFTLSIIFASIGYPTSQPNISFPNHQQEIMSYLSCRTGVLAFALSPLVILFSGRNNILLWLTNWSHSTFIVLHRWTARIFTVHVVLHSVIELIRYMMLGEYPSIRQSVCWTWGVVATVTTCLLLLASVHYFRRRSYEIFLIVHIVLAVFVLVGSWYHVYLRYGNAWGYQYWLYAAFALWIFDRLLRVLRVAKTGIRRARVTDIGGSFVRVDVEGVRWGFRPGQHAYAHFPTLTPLRPWENHPFSVIPTASLRPRHGSRATPITLFRRTSTPTILSKSASTKSSLDVEKSNGLFVTVNPRPLSPMSSSLSLVSESSHSPLASPLFSPMSDGSMGSPLLHRTGSQMWDGGSNAGVSLYIKKSRGTTKFLTAHENLLTLLDGPYRSNSTTAVLKCDRLLLIAGGVGITGLISWRNAHISTKLCWSVRRDAQCIVDDLVHAIEGFAEREVKVGERFDIPGLLDHEVASGWEKIGVVVCGPGALCDDVRAAVTNAGRQRKAVFELLVDAYT